MSILVFTFFNDKIGLVVLHIALNNDGQDAPSYELEDCNLWFLQVEYIFVRFSFVIYFLLAIAASKTILR